MEIFPIKLVNFDTKLDTDAKLNWTRAKKKLEAFQFKNFVSTFFKNVVSCLHRLFLERE